MRNYADTAEDGSRGDLHHRAGVGRGQNPDSAGGDDEARESEAIRLQIDRLQMKLEVMQIKYFETTGIHYDPVTGKRVVGKGRKLRPNGVVDSGLPFSFWIFCAVASFLLGSAVFMQVAACYKYEWQGSFNAFFGLDIERAKRDLGFHWFDSKRSKWDPKT